MIPDWRMEGVVEEVGRKLTTWGPGGLADILQCACDRFDLLLASLEVLEVSQTNPSPSIGDCKDLVIEVLRPPFWHQILFELSGTN